MVGPFTSIFDREESLPMQAISTTYRACSSRAHWGKDSRSVARSANVLLEGFQVSEPVQEGISHLISARQLTNHIIAVSLWDRDMPDYGMD